MIAGSIGRRYAKAYFELIRKESDPSRFLRELVDVQTMIDSSVELKVILSDPTFDHDQQKKIITALVGSMKLSALSFNFLRLLIDHDRITDLESILKALVTLIDQALQQVRVEVTSAVALPESLQKALTQQLENKLGRKVILEPKVQPEVLGGLLVQIGDEVFDATLKRNLSRIKSQIWNTVVP